MAFSLIPAGCKDDSEKLNIFGPQTICDRIKVNGWIEKYRSPLPLKYVKLLLLNEPPPAPQANHPVRNNNARLYQKNYITVYMLSNVCQLNFRFF